MKKLFISLLISVCFLQSNATNYYFSQSIGNDARTSTQATNQATPWQSIGQLNSFFPSILPGDSVLFKRGDVWEGVDGGTITFGSSGANDNYIIIAAYGTGAKPIISGMLTLTWPSSTTNNKWESTNSSGTMPSDIHFLTVGGVPTAYGRYPDLTAANGGYLKITTFSGTSSLTATTTGFTLPASPDFDGGEVVVRTQRWKLDKAKINNDGHSESTLAYGDGGGLDEQPNDIGFGLFIQKHINTLSVHNEWYYNTSTKKITIYQNSNSVPPLNVRVATLTSLINANGKDYITISDIDFEGCNGTAISVPFGSNRISVINCRIEGVGINGIELDGQDFTAMYDTILNCYNSAIDIGLLGVDAGWGEGAKISNNYIRNTYFIAGMGRSGDYQGAGVMNLASDVIIHNNQMINSGYVGVFGYYRSNVSVKYNIIDSFCTVKDDGGGIYFVGRFANNAAKVVVTNVKVISNIVSNAIGAGHGTNLGFEVPGSRAKAKGLYSDVNGNNINWDSNTVINTERGIYINHGNSDNTFRHNNVINSTYGGLVINSDADETDGPTIDQTITNNIFFNGVKTKPSGGSDVAIGKFNEFQAYTIANYGTINYNYYLRPLDATPATANIMLARPSSSTINYTFAQWKTNSSGDANSSLAVEPYLYSSTADMDSSVVILVNHTGSPVTTHVLANYTDVYENVYIRNITVGAYKSGIFFKTSPFSPDPTDGPGKNYIRSYRRFK